MIAKSDVMRLIDAGASPAVSLYMPFKTVPPETEKNEIRLRNLTREAETRLRMGDETKAPTLPTAEALRAAGVWDDASADPRSEGLAVFVSAEGMQAFALPFDPGEQVHVGREYAIEPLLGVLDDGDGFFVVTLEQETPTLYRADSHGLSAIDSDAMVDSMAKIEGMTELPADVGFHPAGSASGGRPDARFHAQGESPADYRQIQLDQFARGVADAVSASLKNERAPLVAVGEPNLLGMFRQHCDYPGLVDEAVNKSPRGLDETTLHQEALDLARPALEAPRTALLERLTARINRGDETATVNAERILVGAREGRVEALLLADGAGTGASAGASAEGYADIEQMARETLTHGGAVLLVPAETLPDEARAGALLRY